MTTLQTLLQLSEEKHHAFLKQLFAHCPQQVYASMELMRWKKHETLISTHASSNAVYVLLQGHLQAIEERVVDIPYSFADVRPIDIVGDFELFTGVEGHYVSLETLEPSIGFRIPSPIYLEWIKSDANALFIRTQMLMKEMSVQTQRQRQQLFLDNRSRMLLFVYRSLPQQGGRIQATREQIASQIGCSVRTCNRIILTLSKEGLLHCVHGKLVVEEAQMAHIKKELDAANSLSC